MSSELQRIMSAAGIDPNALGPFGAIVEAMDALVQSRLSEAAGDLKAARASSAAEAVLAALDDGLHPDHVYSYKEAARLTGKAVATLRKESDVVLPPVLSSGKRIGFRGVDLLAYRGDLTFEEARAYREAQRKAVLRRI